MRRSSRLKSPSTGSKVVRDQKENAKDPQIIVKAEKDDDDDHYLSDHDEDGAKSKSNIDDEAAVFLFDGVEYATYQEMVNAKRKRNQEVLINSGLLESAATMKTAVSKAKPQAHGIKKRKKSEPEDVANVQRRKSNRQAGIQSDGLFVEEERNGRFAVASNGTVAVPTSDGAEGEEREPDFYRDRINDGSSLSLEEVVELTGSKWAKENSVAEAQDFVRGTLSKLISVRKDELLQPEVKKSKSPRSVTSIAVSSDDILSNVKEMTFKEETVVAKVVPDRIYAIAAHPSADQLIVAAGDKKGYVGIWNVDSRAKDDDSNDGVNLFRFHTGSASCLEWTASGNALFSASYDGTVRLFDVASESFEQVFATYDSQDRFKNEPGYGLDTGYKYWTQYGCLDHRNSEKCFFLSTSRGTAMHVDMRSRGGITFHEELSEKKINTLSLHPNGYSLASAGLDGTVNVWDIRKFGDGRASARSRSPKAVVSYNGGRSVNSAFFSPSGQYMVSTTMGNKLDLFENAHLSNSNSSTTQLMKPTTSVSHDNATGRWLCTLMAQWHPCVDMFAVGCMKQPRRIELFDTKGKTLHALQGEALTAVASRCCFHRSTDQMVIVGGNSSGRVTVFRS